jgi:pseudouridine synthase
LEERLQKLMAQAGLGSRRDNEKLIEAGRVRVNGRVARLGDKADPAVDVIEVDNSRLNIKKSAYVYVMLNKPKNVISSLEDELGENRVTVRDLVNIPGHLYPVGRLDRESEGLVLLTNDGDMAHKLTHPRYSHEKVYRVVVEGRPSTAVLDQWRRGVLLDDKPTRPVQIEIREQRRDYTTLHLVMREGRKRQIRRIAAMLGHPVSQLVREQIGSLKLDDLKPGAWRHLTEAEVKALRQTVKQKPAAKSAAKPATPDKPKRPARPPKKYIQPSEQDRPGRSGRRHSSPSGRPGRPGRAGQSGRSAAGGSREGAKSKRERKSS